MKFSVTILGSGAAIPTIERKPTAQLVNVRERLILLDCAEGTQIQIITFRKRFHKIKYIFITHLHGDHYFGLIGVLTSLHLLGRQKELILFGPPGLKEIIDIQLHHSKTTLIYPLIFKTVGSDVSELLLDDGRITVTSFPLKHSIPTWGFLIREKPLSRGIRKDFAGNHDIPIPEFERIKNGHDFIDDKGIVYKNEDITIAPPLVRSYAYCTDTAYFEDIIPVIKGVDVLYHEATFSHELADNAHEKLHSTVLEAATIAKKAGVGKLIIGHFSARYRETETLLKEAVDIFPNTIVAEDGMEIEIV